MRQANCRSTPLRSVEPSPGNRIHQDHRVPPGWLSDPREQAIPDDRWGAADESVGCLATEQSNTR